MLSHQKHVAKIGRCSYNAGLIVSPSGIGHVDMGHAEESEEHGNVSEDLNARSQAPVHATDYTWKSSQEIIFRIPSRSRTWRSSRGIVFSGPNPSPIPTRASSHSNRRQRALSTSVTKQISSDLLLTSSPRNHSLESLGTNQARARISRPQSLNSVSLLNDTHALHGLPQSRTSILAGRIKNGHLAARLYWSDELKAVDQDFVEKRQSYWDHDLLNDPHPFYPVRNGYIELLKLIHGLLSHKNLRLFPKIRLRLCDSYDDIRFMKDDLDSCMSSYRGSWDLKESSDQVLNQQGDGRTKKQRILSFELYNHRLLEPARLLGESQPKFFHYRHQLIATKRRSMRLSKRLRRIVKLCMTTAIPPESFRWYNDLLIARYLYWNGGKNYANAWLFAHYVSNNMRALFRDMKNLINFWACEAREARTLSVRRYGCQNERWRYEQARMTFKKIYHWLKQSRMQLRRDLLRYQDTMIGHWADSSPDGNAIAIYGVEWAKKPGPFGNGIQDAGKGITQATSDDCSTDMSKPLEFSQSHAVPHSSLSDLTMSLSIQPTKKMAQQQISSLACPALSVPHGFLSTRHEVMRASTKHSILPSNEQCFNNVAEAKDTAQRTLQAHVPVENNKKPCQHYLSPLGYHIPEKQLADAKLACPSTRASYWQYLLYRGSNGERVKVHYCKSKATTERIAQLFLNQEVLGFDIEWKPQALATEGIKKNVALIQIASEERIALFHIARYWEDEKNDDLLAPTLKEIMESTKITKVGVSIKADCTRLRKFMGIHSRGLFELSHLYKLVKFSLQNVKMINKKLVSLSFQVEEHLQLPMWKGDVRSSDWSGELDYEQIYYAASDSYAGFQLYHVLEGKRKALDPSPPRPSHAELNLPIRLADGHTVATYDEGVEVAEEHLTDLPPDPSISLEEMARDFLNVAVEDAPANSKSQPKLIKTQSPSAASPQVAAANEWVSYWRSTLPSDYKARATPASLRAYALWHHQDFDVPDVAALLRDPPLKEATVASYVLEAIRIEKLPHAGRKRLTMVIDHLNKNLQGRYQRL